MKEGILVGDAKLTDGWFFSTKTGIYGTNYKMRALHHGHRSGSTARRTRCIRPPRARGFIEKYSGAKKYVLHSTRAKCRRLTDSGR